jgi:HSP20 family protein
MARHSLVPFNLKKYIEPFNWLRRDIEMLSDNFWAVAHLQPNLRSSEKDFPFVPDTDITETDNEFILSVDLPGLEEKDINVEIRDNILRICGEKRAESEQKDKNFHRLERVSGYFDRSIQLPNSISEDNIQASLKNGVLTITFPKTAESINKAKHIEVQKA